MKTVDGEQREDPLEVVLMSIAGANEDDATDTQRFSVGILDWLELQDEVVVVMERPVPSMDLIDYLEARGGYLDEEEAKEILKQLVQAMIDIHSKGVVHRDIKLDNILIQSVPEGLRLWILDFGCGSFLTEDPYSDFGGTKDYSPPEWFDDRSYNAEPFTVWQIGVTLFVLLNGRFPFNNPTDIVSQELYIPWYLSLGCRDLLECCLDKRPGSRPSLENILQHPWLTNI
ncbi:serine/threonine-protein kinase pim-2-like [Hoplias malabaricus]|uniref:serine/threonine-protein kinase pim-2-like n=1 Tax=Hoplias malabaricus TaxID=27720 RepID=UPI0034618DEA